MIRNFKEESLQIWVTSYEDSHCRLVMSVPFAQSSCNNMKFAQQTLNVWLWCRNAGLESTKLELLSAVKTGTTIAGVIFKVCTILDHLIVMYT